jgi:hypothetical protein
MFADYDDGTTPGHEAINQFASLFWMERQWFFELASDFDEFIYSIHPYRYIGKNMFYGEIYFSFQKEMVQLSYR